LSRAALRSSALVELVTSLALLVSPTTVLDALIGSSSGSAISLLARVLGGTLLGLGIAGWMATAGMPGRPVMLAFVVYNVSAALILAVGGLDGTADGVLLWPAVALHGVISAALIAGIARHE
jgi:hypothetical protein